MDNQEQRRPGRKSGQSVQSTRGRWVDTRNGTVYEGTLRDAVFAIGGRHSDYYRAWKALRKQRPWPDDVPIRPATLADVQAARRTVVYEVEMALPEISAHTIEETVLRAGGWVRRLRWEMLPKQVRAPGHRRCTWLVEGVADWGWLLKLVEASSGRMQEVDEGQYRYVYRKTRQTDAP